MTDVHESVPYTEDFAGAYDAIFTDDAAAEQVADFLAACFVGATTVLELGIGTGRIAMPLARRGIGVLGVDDSEPMLRALHAKLGPGDGIQALHGDMRALPELAVDGVYSVLGSLSCLPSSEARRMTFAGARRAVQPGARLVLEVYNPAVIRAMHAGKEEPLVVRAPGPRSSIQMVSEYRIDDDEDRWLASHRWRDGELRRAFSESVALVELQDLAVEAEPWWRPLAALRDWTGAPLGDEPQPMAILVLEATEQGGGRMIEVDGITKRFATTQALHDVSFDVPAGTITGFVGNNGAGKSTTMRAILGLLTVDAGEIRADGAPITAAYRSRIGYMPEEQALYPEMSVRRQLLFFARVQGIPTATARATIEELLDLLDLSDRGNDRVATLSLGNRQRVQLISTLVSPPQALVLDEPFSGMDPRAVDAMERTLRSYAADGMPVLFSSHQLDLVERLCDRVVIIADGAVLASEELAVLLRGDESSLAVTLDDTTPFEESELPDARVLHVSEQRTRVLLRVRPDRIGDVVRSLAERHRVASVEPTRSTLSEIYRERVSEDRA